MLPYGKHSMALLTLFGKIFGCFTAADDDKVDDKQEVEDIPCEEIMSNAEPEPKNPGVWPPRKHKDQMIAMMADYWDQRIAEFEREQMEVAMRAAPKKKITEFECQNSIEV